MTNPKVSLVFPCYHAGKHMQHVLEDIQAQTFPDFEVILVNDGDDSQVEEMEAIAANDDRIRIIHLPQNRGIAAARNAGTDAVTTDWVTYPDPDDRFGPNYVQSLFEAANGTDVDLVCGGHVTVIVKNNKKKQYYIQVDRCSKPMDMVSAYELLLQLGISASSWDKLYSVPLMLKNHLRQDESFPICQDDAFNLVYFTHVKRVRLINDCGYIHYFFPYGSNSTSSHALHLETKIRLANLKEHFHRCIIGWPKQRIESYRRRSLVSSSIRLIKTLYNEKTKLTFSEKAKLIQTEVMDNKEVVDAILQYNFEHDRLGRILQILFKIGNSWIIAFSLTCFNSIKRCIHF